MEFEIASLEEIADALVQAQKLSGKSIEDIARETNLSRGSWYRVIAGDIESGCVTVAKLGKAVGLKPNEVLIRRMRDEDAYTEPDEKFPALTLKDRSDFLQLKAIMNEITVMGGIAWENGQRPVETVLDFMRKQKDAMLRARAKAREDAERVEHLDSGNKENRLVSEETEPYGKMPE